MKRPSHVVTIVGVLILLAVCVASYALRLDAFLPHQKISIILPFDAQYDAVTGMIPMGETIFHPKPQSPRGHPGIDFGGQVPYPFIASADGVISRMVPMGSSDGIDIYLTSGEYSIVYKEMDPNRVFVTVGQHVKQGDKIAMPDPKVQDPNKPNEVHYSTHWEFGSVSPVRDRFCPLTYFTPESRARIEAIWSHVSDTDAGGVKRQFADICSGDYAGRVE